MTHDTALGDSVDELTAIERGIRSPLIQTARDHAIIDYSDLAAFAGVDWSDTDRRAALDLTLVHISAFEHEHGRPLLSAAVIDKRIAQPRSAFFELAGRLGLFDPASIDQHGFFAVELAHVFAHWQNEPSSAPPPT